MKIDAKIEIAIAKWVNFDRIKKLSDLYREKQKSDSKFLDLCLSIEAQNYQINFLKIKNFEWTNNYDFYDMVEKRKIFNFLFISIYKQLINLVNSTFRLWFKINESGKIFQKTLKWPRHGWDVRSCYNEYNTTYEIGYGQTHRNIDWKEFYSYGFITVTNIKKNYQTLQSVKIENW